MANMSLNYFSMLINVFQPLSSPFLIKNNSVIMQSDLCL